MSKINTVASRARLADRAEPYWARVIVGVYLGFRKTATANTWSIRWRDPATLKQKYKSLGDFGTIPDAQRYDAAFKEAQAFVAHLAAGGIAEPKTVADACAAYVAHLHREQKPKAAEDAQQRYARYVLDDARLAATELTKLTRQQIAAWRQRLEDRPVHRGTKGPAPSVATDRKRSNSSLNRDMTPFRAALNHAFDQGWATSDNAWRVALRPIKDADNKRDGYLDRTQRQQLVQAAEGATAQFLKALCMLPVRPGALAQLTVADYDPRRKLLSVTVDKTGARQIVLPDQAAAFFVEQCRGKLPGAFIFPREACKPRVDGKPTDMSMGKDAWKNPIKAAVVKAGLPATTTAYSLRHSTITDLVTAGLPTLTVAQISGTSVRMIEKHYGHLLSNAATAALAALAI
jgi:site-specific recombinase XerD